MAGDRATTAGPQALALLANPEYGGPPISAPQPTFAPRERIQQKAMADAVRGPTQTLGQWRESKLPAAQPGWTPGQAGTAEGGRVSGLFSTAQNEAALRNIYAGRNTSGPSNYDPGGMDYSGEVATYKPGAMPERGYNWEGMLDQYNPRVPTENRFANWYFENEGDPREGERIFDRKWIKDFDTVSKLPEYTSKYGKPPANATDQEKLDWMGLVNTGGATEAMRQSTVSENKKTDMTEAAIMMAASAGMGALAAPAGATFLASSMTPASMAGTAASAAYNAGGDPGYIPQQAATADAVRKTGAVPGSPYYEWLKSKGQV